MSISRRSSRTAAMSPWLALLLVAVAATQPLPAQQQQVVPGSNVNMVSGTTFPDGDPYLQRQNEPSSAVSTRNPSHILGGSNDYRTVDLPGPLDPIRGEKMNADAWAGLYKSFDGGQTWISTLLPGYPQDTSEEGQASPIRGRHAATDAVVRAGTNGMFYYAGLAFDRGDSAPSTIFVARYMDLNNLEAGDPIAYLDTRVVDSDTGVRFLDKTALATDVPRGSARCAFTVNAPGQDPVLQDIPAGNVYVAYTAFTGSDATLQSQIMFSRSTDCGVTWSPARSLSIGSRLVQNAQIAVSPSNGHVYVSWRRFRSGTQDDAVMVVKSTNGGASFGKPVRVAGIRPFDQGTTETSFRSNGFQTITVDAAGRAYLAWTERGHATLRPDPITGDARIVVSTSTTGSLWTVPRPISTEGVGHQLMPALTFHGGKLRLLYYDLREDVSQIFGPYVDELPILTGPVPRIRHTIDVYVAQAQPGAAPAFTSTRLSDYAFGYTPDGVDPVRLQYNPPNLPLFRMGTTPFMGDYIDLAPAPAFVQDATGAWVHNVAPSPNVMSHAFWTDNRDVRAPADGDWTNYTPVTSSAVGVMSRFDPAQPVPPCVAGQVGMRNQNIYTARVSEGLFLTAPANNKPLGTIQRSFVIIAENATADIRSYRLVIDNQPQGGSASFLQFSLLETLDVTVPPYSSVARTVFVTSSIEDARISVSLAEIAAPGDPAPLPGGLTGSVVLNPDPEAPRIQNPRIQNPRIQNPLILDAEAYNPGITNAVIAAPRIQNPRIQNPSILNPRIQNPRIQNDGVQTPRIQNDSVSNPGIINAGTENTGIENTGIANPRIQNPRIQNADLTNAGFTDTSWEITNDGNTTTAYTVNLVMNTPVPAGFATQLLIHKTLYTPTARNCELAEQPHTILLANIPDPEFVPVTDVANPRIQNPRIQNPTLALAPGETASITLRVVDPNRFDGVTYDASAAVTPAAVAQSVNTLDVVAGIFTPPVALPLTITTADLGPAAPGSPYSQTLTAFGTTGDVTWTVQEGSLPPGMTLSPDGTLSGTPDAPGTYVFTVRSTDAAGNTDDQRLFIQVNPTVPAGYDSLWNGQDTDWSNPLNWSPRGVPEADDRVYISAAVSTFPSLTRDVTVRDLFVEPGATLNTNGFILTVTGNVDAGRTITGAGRTVVTGDGSTIAGTFEQLEIRGRATLSSRLVTMGSLILAAGSRLDLNGQAAFLGGPLTTDVSEGAVPLVVGPSPAFESTGINANGLVIRGVQLRIQPGPLMRFDNVSFDAMPLEQPQLVIRNHGQVDAFDAHGISFFVYGDPPNFVRAVDIDDAQPPLVINFVNAILADGSESTTTEGGAVVNWIFDPDDVNLGVVQSVAPVPAPAGSRLTYTIRVSNGSAFAVEDVVLNPGVPIGAQAVNTEVSQGACAANSGGWTCNLGVIPEGQFAEATISYIWPTAGQLTTTATVTTLSDAIDVLPANNSHTVVATLLDAQNATDLSITKTDSADPAAVGAPFQYVLTVTNDATTAADNVTVNDFLPTGFTVQTTTPSAGSCTTVLTQVICGLGTLAGGQSATITIMGTASAAGMLTNTASVLASGIELTPSNNVVTETTVVALVESCSATFSGPVTYGDEFGPATFLTAADMNHDGRNDLVVSHQTGNNPSISVLLNGGAGTFGPRIAAALPSAGFVHAVADFNGDTHPDVMQGVSGSPNTLRLLLGDGEGNLTLSATSLVVSSGFLVASGDLDRDGDQDVVGRGVEGNLVWFANAGDGTFGPPLNLYLGVVGPSAIVGDVNNDAWPDVVAAGLTSGLVLVLSDGAGGFSVRTSESAAPLRVREFVDVNGDSRLDLLIGEGNQLEGTGRVSLLFGDGFGGFGNPNDVNAGGTVGPVATGDVNGDGRVDLVSAHRSINAIAVQLGTETFGFGGPIQYAAPNLSNPVVADFDQDGRPDIAIGDPEGRVRVFLNTCGQPPADLELTLSEAADPVDEGDEIVHTMTVTNHGPSTATGVRLTFAPSTEASNAHIALDASSTSTFPGAVLSFDDRTGTWLVPSLASGASATFELRLRPFGGGTVTLAATVTHGGADAQPANNSALESTVVLANGRIILVTNTDTFGPGSLNQAIEESNADAGDVDRIHFNIPGAGPHIIAPTSRLESISQPAIIDATTQPGFAGTPVIVLDGANLAGLPVSSRTGLTIIGPGGVTIRGFVIHRFGMAIDAFGPGNTIQGNYIGTDVTGMTIVGNALQGVAARQNTLIGGTLPAHRNIISGNQNGIVIDGSVSGGAFGNVVQGNYIGVDVTGTNPLPNSQSGVFIGFGATNNTVGGTAAGAGNVISGNTGSGVSIQSSATGNVVEGNRIGTDATGVLDLGNNLHGIFIDAPNNRVGGATPAARNIISGNGQRGVQLHGNALANVLMGNYVGLRADGTAALANGGIGILIHGAGNTIGGTVAGAGNVISGNGLSGIWIDPAGGSVPSGNRVEGNLVGTSADGLAAVPNGNHGIMVSSAPGNIIGSPGPGRNVVSGNGLSGVVIQNAAATGNFVQSNYIGTDITGSAAIPNLAVQGGIFVLNAPVNFIGGEGPAGNVVSGHPNHGITVVGAGSTGNRIQGNLVGLAANGVTRLANAGIGIDIVSAGSTTIGGNSSLLRNYITGNNGPAIQVRTGSTGIEVTNNYIGLSTNGQVLGNGGPGVYLQDQSDVAIGVSAGNVIAGNATGITIVGANSVRNHIINNEIYGNSGLAIDLGGDGPTPNDSGDGDAGPNELQNLPQLFPGELPGQVMMSFNGAPNQNIVVHFYRAEAGCTGATRGSAVASLGGASFLTDANGNAVVPFAANIDGPVAATAADSVGNTSEFSFCATPPPAPATFTVTNTNDSGAGSARQAILDANARPGLDAIVFNIPGTAPFTIALTSALPTITDPMIIDGTTQPGYDGTPIVELNGANAGESTNGLQITAGSSTVRGLVINRFGRAGIALSGGGSNVIQGNFIGVSSSGMLAAGNGPFGVEVFGSQSNLIGGLAPGDRNVIAAAWSINISLQGGSHNNTIVGNLIGLNVAGTDPLGPQQNGVYLIGSDGNQIGGTVSGARNIIAGHNGSGQLVISAATGTVVQGNYIGTNAAGSAAFPLSTWGIQLGNAVNTTVGGSQPGAGNVISGNAPGGIVFFGTSTNNTVAGNLIGTAADGATALPNGSYGIGLQASTATNNLIGGLTPVARNVIAFNAGAGVAVSAGANNQVLGNHVHSNGGLGIDLGTVGVTPNDAGDGDAGANNLQNFPVLTSAVTNGATTALEGMLSSSANTAFRIEFFANVACDPSGHGEGQVFAGFVDVTTDGSGNATFDTTVSGTGIFTATATDPAGNTSEFSACRTATIAPQTFTVVNTNDSGPGSFRQAILDANARTGTLDTIAFNVAGTGPHTIAPTSALPVITDPVVIDGTTQPGFDGAPLIELEGTNAGGSSNGLHVTSGGTTIRSLVINRFGIGGAGGGGAGVVLTGTGSANVVEGSYIGTDVTGTLARPNRTDGIWMSSANNRIGGSTAVQRNVISGNGRDGILVTGAGASGNRIEGNYIGTAVSGAAPLGNSLVGVEIFGAPNNIVGGTTADTGNVISGNGGPGVSIVQAGSTGNIVGRNYIGLNAAGTAAVSNSDIGVLVAAGASNNTIGGEASGPNAGTNVISGNDFGVQLSASGNFVRGNVIGLRADLGAKVPNSSFGIAILGSNNTIGGSAALFGNIVTGNIGQGIRIDSGSGNLIQGNLIGANPVSASPALTGNGGQGVLIVSSNNTVGGTAATGNVIRNNGGPGIGVSPSGTGNTILFNSITGNTGLGIDLTPAGITVNDGGDGDTGANNLQNHPVLEMITSAGGSTTIDGTMSSAANTLFRIQFFSDAECDASSYGEGSTFIGETMVTTNASGTAPISVVLPTAVTADMIVTATATDPNGNTSEFSPCGTPSEGPTSLTVSNTNDSGPGSLRQAILDANARPGLDTIAFNMTGTVPFTIAPASQLPAITDPVIIDGFTHPSSDQTPVVEISGVNAPSGTRGLWIFSGGTTIRGLTINGFTNGIGVYLDTGGGNLILGNRIGTDWTGTVARPNAIGISVAGSGNNVIGGAASGRNLISGNSSAGIDLSGTLSTSNLVAGNYIGLNANGTAALVEGASANGIRLASSGNMIGGVTTGERNVISGFSNGSGVFVTLLASNNTIVGNYIGTSADGLEAVANLFGVLIAGTGNTVGLAVLGGVNVISGNSTGVRLSNSAGPGTTVVNNIIGLDPTGATLANGIGIETSGPNTLIGGTGPHTRNIISGNQTGLRLIFGANFSRVEGNTFGLDLAGAVRPNTTAIDLNSVDSVTIGGLAAGAGNTIAHSAGAGVQLLFGVNNAIRRNSIHSNGGLGIDLTPLAGVTPNDALDADAGGANDLQNFPVLSSVIAGASSTTVNGMLHSTPNSTFVVDFFTNTSCDPSGNGEGQTWWGSANYITDANGNAPIALQVPGVVLSTSLSLTATALNVTGGAQQSSSEFSNCVQVTAGGLSGGGFEAPVDLFASASLLTSAARPAGTSGVRERDRWRRLAGESQPRAFNQAAAAPLALLLLMAAVGTRNRRSRRLEAAARPTTTE